MAPSDPPRKPWGAPASYGRGTKKPPTVGAHARRPSTSVYNPPPVASSSKPRGNNDEDEFDGTGAAASGDENDANFRAWQRVASNAKASSTKAAKPSSKSKPNAAAASKATPESPFGAHDMDSLAAPDGSYVPLGDHAHASFHDLGPEEKRKVAKLIRQVVELSEARAKLEKELETLKGRCATEEGARRDAETAEANGRAEIESLRTRLDEALATINALGGGHAGMLGMGPSGELTITPLPDTPARRTAAPNTAVSPASAGKDSPAAVGLVTEPTEESIASPSIAPAGSPPETIVVRTNATETTPKPSTPPAAVLAAAKERAAAAENAANTQPNKQPRQPPNSPFVPGLSPGSARDLRWLSAVQSGAAQRAPAWAKSSMLAAAARNAAAHKIGPGSGGSDGSSSSSPSPVTPTVRTGIRTVATPHAAATPTAMGSSQCSGATMNMTLSPDSVGAAPTPGEESTSANVHSVTPELPAEVRAAAKKAAAADPDDALVAALAAAAAAQAGIHWEPFDGNSIDSPRAEAAGNSIDGEPPKVLRFDPNMGPSGAFYFADASVDTTTTSSVAVHSPAPTVPTADSPAPTAPAPGGTNSFDASFAVESDNSATKEEEEGEGAPKDVFTEVAEKVTAHTVASVLGVDPSGRRVSAEEATEFLLEVDRKMTNYASAAAGGPTVPSPTPESDGTFAFSDASFSAVMHPPLSPPSRIIEDFLVLKGTTPVTHPVTRQRVVTHRPAPSPETAAALEACLGVTDPRADPVGDHVSSAPVTPVRAFDEFVKRRHGDGRASSIVAAAAETVRLGMNHRRSGGSIDASPAGHSPCHSPAPPPSVLSFGRGTKPAFVMTPNSLAARREKAAAVAERLLALERTEAAALERVEVSSPSPARVRVDAPVKVDAPVRTPPPVAWEIPSPQPLKAATGPSSADLRSTKFEEEKRDTPARLLDDARSAFSFDLSLIDLVDEAEAMLREEREEDEMELSDDEPVVPSRRVSGVSGRRTPATHRKPTAPRTAEKKRTTRDSSSSKPSTAARRAPARTPLGPMRPKDYNKFGGVRTPPSRGKGGDKPGWAVDYRSFSIGKAGEPGL